MTTAILTYLTIGSVVGTLAFGTSQRRWKDMIPAAWLIVIWPWSLLAIVTKALRIR